MARAFALTMAAAEVLVPGAKIPVQAKSPIKVWMVRGSSPLPRPRR